MINPEAKLNKGFANIIVIIIGVLVLAGVGVGYLVINKQKTVPAAPVQNIVDETADWKNYRNDAYAYELKYPQSWITKDVTTQLGPTALYDNLIAFNPKSELKGEYFNIFVLDSNNLLEKSDFPCEVNQKDNQILVDGVFENKCGLPGGNGYAIYISKENLIYGLFCPNEKANGNICTQMVSTFKVTQDGTANWRVNKNVCGETLYEVKLPNSWSPIPRTQFDANNNSAYAGNYNNEPYHFFIFCNSTSYLTAREALDNRIGPKPDILAERPWFKVDGMDANQREESYSSQTGGYKRISTYLIKNKMLFSLSFQNDRADHEINKNDWDLSSKILSTFSLTSQSVTDKTANLKVYKNDKWGFEFKYPADHTPYSSVDPKKEILIPATKENDYVALTESEKSIFCCESITLTIAAKNEAVTPAEWFEKNYKFYTLKDEIKSQSFINFSGKSGVLEVIGGGNLGSVYRLLVIPFSNYLIVISENSKSEMLENVLSTFRFNN